MLLSATFQMKATEQTSLFRTMFKAILTSETGKESCDKTIQIKPFGYTFASCY